jgi:hypothetical protein
MAFLHNTTYINKPTTTFSAAELLAITPEDVERYMVHRVYRDSSTPEKAYLRSSTLEVIKKAISWYMPNNNADWNEATRSGNPTLSKVVNDVLKNVKRQEVRRQGKPSVAKRAFTMAEFRLAIKLFERRNEFVYRYRYTTMIKYQYHLIARCDDMAHFESGDLKGHTDPRFSLFSLQTKVFWSKNVLEERNCPDQIFFGSQDPDYCILLALAVYLEIWFTDKNGNYSTLLFSDEKGNSNETVSRLKSRYSNRLLTCILRDPEFVSTSISSTGTGNLGTHSLRKYPATYARAVGCTLDQIDVRGRWKRNSGRVVDRYVDVEQQYIDAKVAAALCVHGAVKYKFVPGSGLSYDWLHKYVVPGIAKFYGSDNNNTIASVLALPLLWACFDEYYSTKLPEWLIVKINNEYNKIKKIPEKNPIMKVPLTVFEVNGLLCIEELITDYGGKQFGKEKEEDDDNDERKPAATTTTNTAGQTSVSEGRNMMNAILIQQQQLQTQLNAISEQVNNSIGAVRCDIEKKMQVVNRNLKKLMVQPARKIFRNDNNNYNNNNNENNNNNSNNNYNNENNFNNENNNAMENEGDDDNNNNCAGQEGGRVAVPAFLGSPKTLHELWLEYWVGTAGNKPAKDFTARERGAVKFRYSKRKVFWDVVAAHVRAGYDAHAAIERIQSAYGHSLSVTNVLKAMTRDRQKGHPNLQI